MRTSGRSGLNFERFYQALERLDLPVLRGAVLKVRGLVIEAKGPPVGVGELCEITTRRGRRALAHSCATPTAFYLDVRRPTTQRGPGSTPQPTSPFSQHPPEMAPWVPAAFRTADKLVPSGKRNGRSRGMDTSWGLVGLLAISSRTARPQAQLSLRRRPDT